MILKKGIRYYKNKFYCLPWKLLNQAKIYEDKGVPIKFVTEDANWAIKGVGINIKNEIDNISLNKMEVLTNPSRIMKKIVHFGSQYMWLNWGQHMSQSNKFISTFFHGKYEDGDEIKQHIEQFLLSVPRLSKVITASTLVEKRLINWNIDPNLIVKIPLGVNTKIFMPTRLETKNEIRKRLNIPKEAILIGSFQKDGMGWKSGFKPKLIKGPDIFVNTLKILSEKGYPIHVLLTGPARGYVIENLKLNNISYHHDYVSRSEDLVTFYQALDIYLITSREEGGPLGLMESMSCGVPVVTTNVGMARDVITDKDVGEISSEICAHELAERVEKLIKLNLKEKNNLKEKVRNQILKYDWSNIALQHWNKVYKDLI